MPDSLRNSLFAGCKNKEREREQGSGRSRRPTKYRLDGSQEKKLSTEQNKDRKNRRWPWNQSGQDSERQMTLAFNKYIRYFRMRWKEEWGSRSQMNAWVTNQAESVINTYQKNLLHKVQRKCVIYLKAFKLWVNTKSSHYRTPLCLPPSLMHTLIVFLAFFPFLCLSAFRLISSPPAAVSISPAERTLLTPESYASFCSSSFAALCSIEGCDLPFALIISS